MATFRRTNLKNKKSIMSALPMINDQCWNESPLLSSRCISIWDKWLHESDTPNALNDASLEQEDEWESYFNQFHAQVVGNFTVFMRCKKKGIFKEIVNNEKAVKKLSDSQFEFLIPEIKVIYTTGYDFSAHIYFQEYDLAKCFFEIVKESKLRFLNDLYS